MMVLMREACPGQSTRVNCRLSHCGPSPSPLWPPLSPPLDSSRCPGRSTVKEEKPRSRVIPRSRDCGFLSKAAVDAVLLSALANDVFPLSTWPRTPTLKFRVLMGLCVESDIVRNEGSFTYCEWVEEPDQRVFGAPAIFIWLKLQLSYFGV